MLKMTYINQIMKETLGINPPEIKIIQNFTAEDIELSGKFIRKGNVVVSEKKSL